MRQHQQLAVAVLRRLDADEALIGDLLEEYEHGRSRVWLWTPVAVAAAVTLFGRARRTRPHSAKSINLATTPRGSAVGGLGVLAMAVLITVVAPQTWWVLGIAVAKHARTLAICRCASRESDSLVSLRAKRRLRSARVLFTKCEAVSGRARTGRERPRAVAIA